jgi:hypothetical protein
MMKLTFCLNLKESFQYRGSVFKVPTMTNWMIVASGPDKVEEIRRAPDGVLSMRDGLEGVVILIF